MNISINDHDDHPDECWFPRMPSGSQNGLRSHYLLVNPHVFSQSLHFLGQDSLARIHFLIIFSSYSRSFQIQVFPPGIPSFPFFPQVSPAALFFLVGGSSSWSWAPWALWRSQPKVPAGPETRGWEGSARRSTLVYGDSMGLSIGIPQMDGKLDGKSA